MSHQSALEQLRRNFDPATYEKVRELWKRHSIAEDARRVDEILLTLSPDCTYEVVGTELAWHGQDGAMEFYRQLLTAIPDAKFSLQHIAIGPQGVFEEAILSGTHQGDFRHYRASHKPICAAIAIFFPFDPSSGLFTGERIYADLDAIFGGTI